MVESGEIFIDDDGNSLLKSDGILFFKMSERRDNAEALEVDTSIIHVF